MLRGLAQPSESGTGPPIDAPRDCKHCAQPLRSGDGGDFCCMGCRVVYGFLRNEGLERFYTFRTNRGLPVRGNLEVDRDWCEEQQQRIDGGAQNLHVAIEGMHCAACTWLVEAIFARQEGAIEIELNAARSEAKLRFTPDFSIESFATQLRRAGYGLADASSKTRARDKSALRFGISAALSMNIMILAIARYLGLSEQPLAGLLLGIETTLATLVLLLGLDAFGRTSWAALRARTPHLDIPIALGMILAWAGSSWSVFAGREGIFFDSLAAFVTLMLLGRWLQSNVSARSRTFLNNQGDVGSLRCRKKRGTNLERVCFSDVQRGDTVVLSKRAIVPTRSRLKLAASEGVAFSIAWITGESTPVTFKSGDEVPAGAISESESLIAVESLESFAESTLPQLLRAPTFRHNHARSNFATWYVAAVVLVGALAFVAWFLLGGAMRGVEVATAFFVVTCPCVFGVVVPLAQSLVHARLRALGVFVRSGGFLERLVDVDRVVLDKTGTLTTSSQLAGAEAEIKSASESDLRALKTLATLSSHPKARIVEELLGEGVVAFDRALASEKPGEGISLHLAQNDYFLGSLPGASGLVFEKGGQTLATFLMGEETLVEQAQTTVSELKSQGYQLSLLSGDEPARAHRVGKTLGFEAANIHGGFSPEQKRAWIEANDPSLTLYVGDGVNDALASEASACSMAPAQANTFIANRANAFWIRDGLESLAQTLWAAKNFQRLNRNVIALAVAYNVLIGVVAVSGVLAPWQAAVIMPLVSLTFTAYALFATRPKRLFSPPPKATRSQP